MSPLIETTDPKIFEADIIIIDVRAGTNAQSTYLSGHLPNAILATLGDDLAAHPTDPAFGGRHPLPSLTAFTATLGRWGVKPDSHIVIYDDKAGAMGGARLWWMLHAIGHNHVQVLNGGLKAAIDAGIALSTDDYKPTPVNPYPIPAAYHGTADIEEVKEAAQAANRMVIDVREEQRYLGYTEPLDLVAGHIPGAVNLFYGESQSPDGKYLSSQELQEIYNRTIGNVNPNAVIVHCGSGVTACHTLLGLAYAGIDGAKLYVGSWSEWSRRDLPIGTHE
jgi:thiosulfate/3-mercaptopyruvate sulfurtransferase